MELLRGVHHITFLTADMDRILAFYERVFGIRAAIDLEEDGLRHALIQVNAGCFLHPFQVPGVEPPGPQPMFERGRVDHFAFEAASEEAFGTLRRRLMDKGASNGIVTDMGSFWIFTFEDPDAGRHEVVWMKPGIPITESLKRVDWTRVEMQ